MYYILLLNFQSKELDLATVPVMVACTVARLGEFKEKPSSSSYLVQGSHKSFLR